MLDHYHAPGGRAHTRPRTRRTSPDDRATLVGWVGEPKQRFRVKSSPAAWPDGMSERPQIRTESPRRSERVVEAKTRANPPPPCPCHLAPPPSSRYATQP